MKSLVEFVLENDDSVLVEIEELPGSENESGLVALPGQRTILKSQQSFSNALDCIKPTAATIIQKVRSLNEPPDEVEVKFGIKMTAETGAVVPAFLTCFSKRVPK